MKLLNKIKSLFQKAEGDFGTDQSHIKAGQNAINKKNVGKEVFRKTGHTLSAGQASSYVPDKEKLGEKEANQFRKRKNVIDNTLDKIGDSSKTKAVKKRVNAIQPTKTEVNSKRSPVKKVKAKPVFKNKIKKEK